MESLAGISERMEKMKVSHPCLAGMWHARLESVRKELERVVAEAQTAIHDMAEVHDMSPSEIAAIWAVNNSA